MKNKILKQITEFCKLCNSHNNCPEDDCVLFRIEKLILKEEIEMKENNKEDLTNKIVELFKNYMVERGYKIWKSETPNHGITYTASKDDDKYIPLFELNYARAKKYKIAEYEISTRDRNGNEAFLGNVTEIHYLYLNEEVTEEVYLKQVEEILEKLYKNYRTYSRTNRLDSVYHNIETKHIDYFEKKYKCFLEKYKIEEI